MENISIISLIFVAALVAATAFQLWLSKRHTQYINAHKDNIPEAFADKITLEQHQKAADYTIAGVKLGQFNEVLAAILLLLWTRAGGLNALDQYWRSFELSTVSTGIIVILSLLVISTILDLPLSIYKTFVHEEKFGFNRTKKGQFAKDQVLELTVSLVILSPLLWVILTLMESAGTYWWDYTWAFLTGYMLFMMWAYPAFIAPLFNKFTLLEDAELKSTIENLLDRCGFASQGIFIMDGSKRSAHGNAYFTGFGAQKRIVFFDTLLKSLSATEIEAVLAHELGHFKRKHIRKQLIVMSLTNLAGLALLGWLITQEAFFTDLGGTTQSIYMGLVLFLLITPVFSIYFQPLKSIMSRKHEFEADEFAAKNSSATALINALVKLYQENSNTLTPDPLYSAFHDSHPPAGIRVKHLQQFA